MGKLSNIHQTASILKCLLLYVSNDIQFGRPLIGNMNWLKMNENKDNEILRWTPPIRQSKSGGYDGLISDRYCQQMQKKNKINKIIKK